MELTHRFDTAALAAPQATRLSFDTLVADLASRKEIVVIADMDHLDRGLHVPLHEKSLYEIAKANGVTKLHLELPKELQGDLNAMLKGNISRDDFLDGIIDRYNHERSLLTEFTGDGFDFSDGRFRDKMDDFAGIAIAAHKAGIKVIAADPVTFHEAAVWSEISNETGPNYNAAAADRFMTRRLERDKEIADDIADAKGGKSIVVIGGMHIMPDARHSLDDALTVTGKTIGMIHLTSEDPALGMQDLQNFKKYGAPVDVPHYIYNPHTGESAARQSSVTYTPERDRTLDDAYTR